MVVDITAGDSSVQVMAMEFHALVPADLPSPVYPFIDRKRLFVYNRYQIIKT